MVSIKLSRANYFQNESGRKLCCYVVMLMSTCNCKYNLDADEKYSTCAHVHTVCII